MGELAQILLVFAINLLLETGEQLAFAFSSVKKRKLLWLTIGCCMHPVALATWVWLLSMVPLSVALPMSALNYVGVALGGYLFLNEEIGRRRVLGIFSIISGLAVIGATGEAFRL